MTTLLPTGLPASLLAATVLLAAAGPAQAADAEAAQALARRSNCMKCHAVDKVKDAKPWREVVKELKGKPDAQERLTKHITTGPKVKLEDGSEEVHPIIKTKNADEIRNLVDWILSL